MLLLAALLLVAAPVQTIELPVEPPSRRTIEFEEVWRSDPESEAYRVELGSRVVVDDDGNLYVREDQQKALLKFDRAGNFVGTLSPPARGSAHAGFMEEIAFWPPAELVLSRAASPRALRMSTDGAPLTSLQVQRSADEHEAGIHGFQAVGDLAVIVGNTSRTTEEEWEFRKWLGVIDRDGNVQHEFGTRSMHMSPDDYDPWSRSTSGNRELPDFNEAELFWEWNRWAVSSEGYLFVAPAREEWKIERYDLNGNLQLVISRDIGPRTRTEEELTAMTTQMERFDSGMGVERKAAFLDTHPACNAPRMIAGRVWVTSHIPEEESPANLYLRATVLTVDGDFVEEANLFLDSASDEDRVQLLSNGNIVVVENGRAPVIVMYRQKR